MERAQRINIINDLKKKMVLLVGPRQSGKTWLALDVAKDFNKPTYLNYDVKADREIMLNHGWLLNTDLLILDELHKMPDWKNYLKGVYDGKNPNTSVLVTGSARLDIFEQLGDSLAGRYFRHRLLPISIAEQYKVGGKVDIETLLIRSGFPEPYLADNEIDVKRWRQQYTTSLLSTDIFEFDNIDNVKAMRLVFEVLRHKVGSPVSYQSISRDVNISPNTVKKYINILENLYVIFKVTPFSKNIARSLLKEPKIYFFDTGLVEGDHGVKLENLVANSLLKHCFAKQDYAAEQYMLHYIRTKDGQEVDFAISLDGELNYILEVKSSDSSLSKSLQIFKDKYSLQAIQLVKNLHKSFIKDKIQVLKVEEFLKELFL